MGTGGLLGEDWSGLQQQYGQMQTASTNQYWNQLFAASAGNSATGAPTLVVGPSTARPKKTPMQELEGWLDDQLAEVMVSL